MSVRVPAIFSDHLVLRRGIPVPVWGWADPGEVVTVRLAGSSARAVAGAAGRWQATLPAMTEGGPYELVISGSETITLHDVLVGEVWVCSGQSNMQMNVGSVENSGTEIDAADYPYLRLFTVANTAAESVQDDVVGSWSVCTPETVGAFSAVGYFFGRELHERLDGMPIGLINSSWGGTPAEAWTSREGLLAEPELRDIVESYEENLPRLTVLTQEFHAAMQRWNDDLCEDPGNTGLAQGWADPATDAAGWQTMPLPQPWQQAGLDISGVLWFRREVEIPDDWAGRELTLRIGACDKNDVTYFNGVEVGAMRHQDNPDSWRTPRVYPVPGTLVQAGRNLIAVRVYSHCFAGGFMGPETEMRLEGPSGDPIMLTGPWQYRIEHNFGKVPDLPTQPLGPGNPHSPHTLFDGMIAPLIPYAIRGVIWYQGESNANRAAQYRTLFPALIRDWRRQWGLGDFPFYFVQLANYMAAKAWPSDSEWAELREAQLLALQEPRTGMAVIIDIGDAIDIHPRNKQDVGRRLALNALAITYKQDIVYSGPLFRAMQIAEDAVRLSFDHTGGGLVARGGQLCGFAVAGEDRVFHWAEARIEGDAVIVRSPEVPQPVAVRYGWADNPACTLYNADGLPASPFRTDNWPAQVLVG